MKNVSDTEAYTAFDHVFLKAVRTISHVVSVRKLTQPFWGRWQASNIGDDVLFGFLQSIGSVDDWPAAARRMAEREAALFESRRASLDRDREVSELRRLSYLCNLGQWGILPIGDEKRSIYQLSRDYYVRAESLAFGENYRRMSFRWQGKEFWANLHCPTPAADGPAPLIVFVHGLDDCKEEHLATELSLVVRGFAVVGFDGPGQGEALLLDGNLWTEDYPGVITAIIDAVSGEASIDTERVGSVGFSIGSLWSIRGAAAEPRVKAVYDLGAPINTKAFARVPFLIKSKMCQITGARSQDEITAVLSQNYIDRPEILASLTAAVRIVHGTRDRVVAMADKVWLRDELNRLGAARQVSMRVFEGGDHCCTAHIPEIRRDMGDFFTEHLL